MDNWKHIITAFVVTIIATILMPLLSRFNSLKLSLACFLLSSLGFGVAVLYAINLIIEKQMVIVKLMAYGR